MNTYYAINFATPPAFESSNIPPLGSIIEKLFSVKTPSRKGIQKNLEDTGFDGYIKIMRADRLEEKFKVEGQYFYKNT